MDELLADLDLEALPGTETDVEVIAEMTADDLDPAASKRSPKDVSAAPVAPAPDPAPDDPDSGLTLEAYKRLSAFAAADEPDWFTRCISRGGPTSETLTEAEIADVEALEFAAPEPPPTAPDSKTGNPKKLVALLQNARAKKAAKAEAKAKDQAAKAERDYENYLLAKAERKREQDRARKNKQRARERAAVKKTLEEYLQELETAPLPYPTPWRRSRPYTARLRALCAATANPRGDSFLVQIQGRELELTDGWVIELYARKKLGEKASRGRAPAPGQVDDQAARAKSPRDYRQAGSHRSALAWTLTGP